MASQTIVLGPWGGTGGDAWDDGSYTGVRTINLTHKEAIGSFYVVYDLNGQPFDGPKHISNRPFTAEKIELRFPAEYLVDVSGYISTVPEFPTKVVRSLTFKTNQRTFGPYGPEEGTTFSIPIENGKVVGFKGRSMGLLDAISIHLAH
ncbi:hypothetical protein TIFTF001_002937 [Ficus carica]|uniref:Jacalin-type lectin domain-containing protein n=1 Tax=Ficus carica TaxID=3494 RepID=A0AA87ZPW7_FICCA|nr:hypothetical protein TIFTF001_002937 [Ficus carica]